MSLSEVPGLLPFYPSGAPTPSFLHRSGRSVFVEVPVTSAVGVDEPEEEGLHDLEERLLHSRPNQEDLPPLGQDRHRVPNETSSSTQSTRVPEYGP